jgi:hypothetical protein
MTEEGTGNWQPPSPPAGGIAATAVASAGEPARSEIVIYLAPGSRPRAALVIGEWRRARACAADARTKATPAEGLDGATASLTAVVGAAMELIRDALTGRARGEPHAVW